MEKFTQSDIEVHERLSRIEAMLEAIKEKLEDQNECDTILDEKIDKILHNDTDKLQRITKTEQKLKHLKTTMFLFAAPIAAGIARWFI